MRYQELLKEIERQLSELYRKKQCTEEEERTHVKKSRAGEERKEKKEVKSACAEVEEGSRGGCKMWGK